MSDDATPDAVNRIDAALARIEQAARHASATRAKLAERHARLRDRVGAALAELDSQIAGEQD